MNRISMAMCKEGGKGSNIRYIKSADNRGAGSYIGNKVEKDHIILVKCGVLQNLSLMDVGLPLLVVILILLWINYF